MKNQWPSRALILAAVVFGAALGACVRNVVGDARAQPVAAGGLEYKLVGASATTGGYEEDLNKYTGGNPALVFERRR